MKKANIKKGFFFYLYTTLVIAIQFVQYLLNSQELSIMDFGGWLFYITSCISHAACLALIPFLIYVILTIAKIPKFASWLFIVFSILTSILVFVNEQVYQLYRFHINGFILNMVTGPARGEIFNFDWHLYMAYIKDISIIVVVYIIGWWLLLKKHTKTTKHNHKGMDKRVLFGIMILVCCTLFAHVYHIFAAFYQQQSVIMSERLIPYYFPTTSYGFLTKTLKLKAPSTINTDLGQTSGEMNYPVNSLMIDNSKKTRQNIVLILVDSWNTRAMTKECMPNVYDYAEKNSWFKNHVSCSNGTKSSVFGLWYGISSYYWNLAESNHISPAILDIAHKEGYTFHNYPSASQLDPPFGRTIFVKEKNVRIDTSGKTTLERDTKITEDFITDITTKELGKNPFFAFLFYDLPHSFELPKEKTNTFQPSWLFADYSKLNNKFDATPFWNLYRNTCYETDKLIGRVIKAINDNHLSDNTIVIITGDHSQEFNENKKNYWGHNGNFSWYQIGVPLVIHKPGNLPHIYTHRTTHYDITPTIMTEVMGVTNLIEDYSMGHLLTDTISRDWHIVGSDLNYAFIIEGDTILEKTAQGSLNVYDRKMNLVTDYHLNVGKFKKATKRLNHFMK